jgi:hypothetical protein
MKPIVRQCVASMAKANLYRHIKNLSKESIKFLRRGENDTNIETGNLVIPNETAVSLGWRIEYRLWVNGIEFSVKEREA